MKMSVLSGLVAAYPSLGRNEHVRSVTTLIVTSVLTLIIHQSSGWAMLHDSQKLGARRLQLLADGLGKRGRGRQYVSCARKEGGLEWNR